MLCSMDRDILFISITIACGPKGWLDLTVASIVSFFPAWNKNGQNRVTGQHLPGTVQLQMGKGVAVHA